MNRIRKAEHHLNASRVLGEWQTLQTFVIQSPTLGHSHTSTEQLLPHIVIDISRDKIKQIQVLMTPESCRDPSSCWFVFVLAASQVNLGTQSLGICASALFLGFTIPLHENLLMEERTGVEEAGPLHHISSERHLCTPCRPHCIESNGEIEWCPQEWNADTTENRRDLPETYKGIWMCF